MVGVEVLMASEFMVQQVARKMCRLGGEIAAAIEKRDPDLARQLRRALTSVCLNIGEAKHRTARMQRSKFAIAYGEANEVKCILECAQDLGYVTEGDTEAAWETADHVAATLYKLIA